MDPMHERPHAPLLATLYVAISLTFAPAQTAAQATPGAAPQDHVCTVDLKRTGMMEDILSNALTRGLGLPADKVRSTLSAARAESANGDELLRRSAAAFQLTEPKLRSEVERFRHINCKTGTSEDGSPESATAQPVSPFARNVTLHVILHELGHALIREFDLPILGNEETMADAFATHYLTQHLPERAPAVLHARVASLMHEAGEVPRAEWPVRGEHNSDARRAYQIAALAVAADRSKYAAVAKAAQMPANDLRRSADYGAEIHRSWRRILQPLWMPSGALSNEARVRHDENGPISSELGSGPLADEVRAAIRRFDWHSQVTVRFVEGDGGAGWSRSKRTITVHSGYVRRFIAQGEARSKAQ